MTIASLTLRMVSVLADIFQMILSGELDGATLLVFIRYQWCQWSMLFLCAVVKSNLYHWHVVNQWQNPKWFERLVPWSHLLLCSVLHNRLMFISLMFPPAIISQDLMCFSSMFWKLCLLSVNQLHDLSLPIASKNCDRNSGGRFLHIFNMAMHKSACITVKGSRRGRGGGCCKRREHERSTSCFHEGAHLLFLPTHNHNHNTRISLVLNYIVCVLVFLRLM